MFCTKPHQRRRNWKRTFPWLISVATLLWSGIRGGNNLYLHNCYLGHQVTALTFSPDSHLLVGGGFVELPCAKTKTGEVYAWNTVTGKQVWTVPLSHPVIATSVSPNGRDVAILSVDSGPSKFGFKPDPDSMSYDIQLIRLRDGTQSGGFHLQPGLAEAHGLDWSPSGNSLAHLA